MLMGWVMVYDIIYVSERRFIAGIVIKMPFCGVSICQSMVFIYIRFIHVYNIAARLSTYVTERPHIYSYIGMV